MNEFQFARTCRMNNGNRTAIHSPTFTLTHKHTHSHTLEARIAHDTRLIMQALHLISNRLQNYCSIRETPSSTNIYILNYNAYIYIKELFIFTSLSPLQTLNFANHSDFSLASAFNWNPVDAEFVWHLLEFSDSHTLSQMTVMASAFCTSHYAILRCD